MVDKTDQETEKKPKKIERNWAFFFGGGGVQKLNTLYMKLRLGVQRKLLISILELISKLLFSLLTSLIHPYIVIMSLIWWKRTKDWGNCNYVVPTTIFFADSPLLTNYATSKVK
jgi:hypothetical protein